MQDNKEYVKKQEEDCWCAPELCPWCVSYVKFGLFGLSSKILSVKPGTLSNTCTTELFTSWHSFSSITTVRKPYTCSYSCLMTVDGIQTKTAMKIALQWVHLSKEVSNGWHWLVLLPPYTSWCLSMYTGQQYPKPWPWRSLEGPYDIVQVVLWDK